MAETASNMLPLGTIAPAFTLYDTQTGDMVSLKDIQSEKATVVMFICNHCPYVKHIQHKMVEIAQLYQKKGVSFVAINSNDVSAYPDDSPDKMKLEASRNGYTFPYLYDETQAIAKAYQAACTPDFYIFDGQLKCVYRGRFDSATPRNQQPVTGADLSAALDNVLAGKAVAQEQKSSLGCNIKWK